MSWASMLASVLRILTCYLFVFFTNKHVYIVTVTDVGHSCSVR